MHETLFVFSHKVAPGVDVGNLVCATGWSAVGSEFFLGLRSSSIVKLTFKSVNEMTDCAVPMGLGILGCSLQFNGCNEVVACRSVRCSCSVNCQAALADRDGTAASR